MPPTSNAGRAPDDRAHRLARNRDHRLAAVRVQRVVAERVHRVADDLDRIADESVHRLVADRINPLAADLDLLADESVHGLAGDFDRLADGGLRQAVPEAAHQGGTVSDEPVSARLPRRRGRSATTPGRDEAPRVAPPRKPHRAEQRPTPGVVDTGNTTTAGTSLAVNSPQNERMATNTARTPRAGCGFSETRAVHAAHVGACDPPFASVNATAARGGLRAPAVSPAVSPANKHLMASFTAAVSPGAGDERQQRLEVKGEVYVRSTLPDAGSSDRCPGDGGSPFARFTVGPGLVVDLRRHQQVEGPPIFEARTYGALGLADDGEPASGHRVTIPNFAAVATVTTHGGLHTWLRSSDDDGDDGDDVGS